MHNVLVSARYITTIKIAVPKIFDSVTGQYLSKLKDDQEFSQRGKRSYFIFNFSLISNLVPGW